MKKGYQISRINNKRNYRRIIGDIRKIEGMENVNLNKDKNTLYVEYADYLEDVEKKILKCFHVYEEKAIIEELVASEVYRKVVILKGLDCGHCAARIESLAKKNFSYERIVVDFSTERFIIETKDKHLCDNLVIEVSKLACRVDPKINVLEVGERQRNEELESKPLLKKHELIMFIMGCVLAIGFIIFKSIITKDIYWLLHDNHAESRASTAYEYIVLSIALFLVGFEVIIDFIKNLFRRHEMDEKFLMSLASIGAIVTGHTIEAISVMVFYQIGKYLQERAVNHSRKSIKALLSFEATTSRLKVDDEEMEVSVESVMPGDILIVKAGEMIPVDGEIVSGKTYLDLKALTGESAFQNAKVGDSVRSGAINLGNVIEVKAKKIYRDSTMSQILDMVENASAAKARTENFITKFAKVYTPAIVAIAFIVAIVFPIVLCLFENSFDNLGLYMLGSNNYRGYIYTGMVFLVIACPCALVISIPLAYFSGIGLASKRGILVKGSNYLEALSKTEYILFDKTDTLTKGDFGIKELVSVDPNYTKEEILKLMAYAEYHSTHPIGKSIVDAYGRDLIFPEIIDDFTRLQGRGVRAYINGARIAVCNYAQLEESKIEYEKINDPDLVLYVLKEKQVIGYGIIGDSIREDAFEMIGNLRKQGVKKISILTGDNKDVSENVGKLLGVDNILSELYPNDKVEAMEKHKETVSKGKKVVYVGDGINDAPVISCADVGIAMGASASEGSIAIADIVVMGDSLTKINEAITISKVTSKIVLQNTILALGIKLLVFIINFFNLPVMIWLAIFSDVGVSLLAIINSLRVKGIFNKKDQKVKEHE